MKLLTGNHQLSTRKSFPFRRNDSPKGFPFRRNDSPKGFTLIELLVVISIIGIITGVSIPAFTAFSRRQTLTQAAKDLKANLKAAQSQAISSVDGQNWGVHFTRGAGSYEVFSAPATSFAYDDRTSSSLETLSSGVTVSNLPWTPANVVFDRGSGTVGVYRDDGTMLGSSATITLSLRWVSDRYVTVEAGGKIYEH